MSTTTSTTIPDPQRVTLATFEGVAFTYRVVLDIASGWHYVTDNGRVVAARCTFAEGVTIAANAVAAAYEAEGVTTPGVTERIDVVGAMIPGTPVTSGRMARKVVDHAVTNLDRYGADVVDVSFDDGEVITTHRNHAIRLTPKDAE